MPRRTTGKSPSELADALHSAAIHLLRRLRREDAASGLSPARLSALSVIAFGGPLRVSDLARAEGVKVPTMTPIVAALEEDGVVKREPDPSDARAAILRATAKGQRVVADGRARRVERLAAALQQVSPDDRRVLARAAELVEDLARGL